MENPLHIDLAGFRIRPFRLSDAESMARYANNSKIWQNLRDSFPHPYSLEDAEKFLHLQEGQQPVFNYCLEVEGHCAGAIGAIPGVDVYRRSAEIGYWLAEPFWGRGIATRAIRELSRFVFQSTPIVRLHAGIFASNPASMRVLEKAGYQPDGIGLQAVFKDGRLINEHRYYLLKGEAAHV